MRIDLANKADAEKFYRGQVIGESFRWRPAQLYVVESVDVAEGVVTVREVSAPYRWYWWCVMAIRVAADAFLAPVRSIGRKRTGGR